MTTVDKLKQAVALDVYDASVTQVGDLTYFLARRDGAKFVGSVGDGEISGEPVGQIGGVPVLVGPTDHGNARAVRKVLPWTAPRCLGLATSVGLGDRLGLATPGHIRAVRGTGLAPILAQQSIREMTRTQRTPDEVMDAATWGVLQEGFREPFGADADHLQQPGDIDQTAAAGFQMFTIDPGRHVENQADEFPVNLLADYLDKMDFAALEISPADLKSAYVGKTFALAGGGSVSFDEIAFLRAMVKYGAAVAHTAAMYRRLSQAARGEFELEVSVDETDSPTTPAEHYFFANELKRLGVRWVSMGPRFVGRFEKGVDYIGNPNAFRESFAAHAAVMRTLGPYKISIHSGSDKFSIYPIVAELTGGLVHLKTAGTSYLEALRALAQVSPALFREILDFARGRYDEDKATYHVSGTVQKVPPADSLKDSDLPALLDQFDARQVLHCTFGSVLTADGGAKFRRRMFEALGRDEEAHYAALAKHLGRHVAPFVQR
ncbi:MAG TPA: hypothetical protein DCX07_00990 [Phycisphaerales bacterium]|nr:hypothetical protein [Phycisphaerales bacterium]